MWLRRNSPAGVANRSGYPAVVAAAGIVVVGFVYATGCGDSSRGTPNSGRAIAEYADSVYRKAAIATLADLVAFRTVRQEEIANAELPEFRAMTSFLAAKAAELELDFADHGAAVVIGLGMSDERLGLVTHGDVVPADPSKWADDPFSLDTLSEPGRLVGRGVVDDKGAIALALYAMKAVKDRLQPLGRRVELIVSYTEESDWTAFRAFLAENPPPSLNVGFDSEYPVVVAEKGWNSIHLGIPPGGDATAGAPQLETLSGGAFLSQVPEDARAVIVEATPEVEERLRAAARSDSAVAFTFRSERDTLTIFAKGLAAHSAEPEAGRNAITHLAALLGAYAWPKSQASDMVRLINDLVGVGDHGRRFGGLSLDHPFMGPLTLTLATLGLEGDTLVAGISIRSPAGRTGRENERILREAVEEWRRTTGVDVTARIVTSDAHYLDDAPHIPVLLSIFEDYTGRPDPQPISIGGGTHARLLPNGVNFGPAMPGEPYTGHSEHEFMSEEQFRLNLRMYTALLVELAGL